MSSIKRVVITGMGIVSSIGNDVEEVKKITHKSKIQGLLRQMFIKKWALEVKYTVK